MIQNAVEIICKSVKKTCKFIQIIEKKAKIT